jgi:acyl carrier protein
MPDRDSIRRTLVELLEADTGEKFPELGEDDNLREELGLDSVDVVSIVMQIECRFRIRLTQQELEKVVKVGDLLDLIQAKLAAPPQTAAA